MRAHEEGGRKETRKEVDITGYTEELYKDGSMNQAEQTSNCEIWPGVQPATTTVAPPQLTTP